MGILGISMHLSFLLVTLILAVSCHHLILFHKNKKYKFIFRKHHHFSEETFRRCLTFEVVYRTLNSNKFVQSYRTQTIT